LLGASTAGYAVVLAGLAALQSQAEQAMTDARGAAVVALRAGSDANDVLAARLDSARERYAGLASGYEELTGTLDSLVVDLGDLTAIVGKIEGASRALPTTVRLPAVRASVPVTRTPVTHATTRASGG
jgi:hypothetical protein